MSRQNDYYNAVQRIFDLRQINNRRAYDLRKQEVYRCVPELEALDNRQVTNTIQQIKAALLAQDSAVPTGTVSNTTPSDYRAQRKKLLTEAGFPEDYLEMHYHCPLCQDRGYIDDKKCKCFKAAYINLLYEDSPLRSALKRENFNTFSYDYFSNDITDPLTGLTAYQSMQKAVETAKTFIADFHQPGSQPRNLLISGNVGVGKTFLTNCIAYELIKAEVGIVYLSANELLSILEIYKFRRDKDDFASAHERHTAILECDLLIIDDLGTELTNSFAVTELFELLNTRLRFRRSTIISTNQTLQQIKETYSERIFSRIVSEYDYIRIFGEDIRLKKL